MARYTLLMDSISITAAQDLARITAGTVGFSVRAVTVRADVSETADKVSVGIYRASTLGTGTAATPLSFEDGSPAFDGTAVVNLTVATTKLPVTPLITDSCDLGGEGPVWVAADGTEDIDVGAGHSIVIRLESAPVGATVMTCTVDLEQ